MNHRPIENLGTSQPFSLYELAARAVVSNIRSDVLVHIHDLQPLHQSDVLEDVMYRIATAICVNKLHGSDAPGLRKVRKKFD